MDTNAVSRGINICGVILDVDPRTGRTEVNHARPFSKRDWNKEAKPHAVTVIKADGTEHLCTVIGARHKELRDDVFMGSVVTGGSMEHTLSNAVWHAYVIKLADRYPDRVTRGPKGSIPYRVLITSSVQVKA